MINFFMENYISIFISTVVSLIIWGLSYQFITVPERKKQEKNRKADLERLKKQEEALEKQKNEESYLELLNIMPQSVSNANSVFIPGIEKTVETNVIHFSLISGFPLKFIILFRDENKDFQKVNQAVYDRVALKKLQEEKDAKGLSFSFSLPINHFEITEHFAFLTHYLYFKGVKNSQLFMVMSIYDKNFQFLDFTIFDETDILMAENKKIQPMGEGSLNHEPKEVGDKKLELIKSLKKLKEQIE